MHERYCVFAALVVLWLMVSSDTTLAQAGRVRGVVKDQDGQSLKGATITAENPDAIPRSITATTDDKGRFAIIGLRSGTWVLKAEAPGYAPSQGNVPVRAAGSPPLTFTLVKNGPPPPLGALAGVNTKDLQAELAKADTLMEAKQYDQAIAAYQGILQKTPSLSTINLQIGQGYRHLEQYDKALAAYQALLKTEPNNEKAKIAIGLTNLEKGDLQGAEEVLNEAAQGGSATREVFYNVGEVQFAQGETEEAVKSYQRAAETDANWGKPLFKLGLLAINQGDKEIASKYMEKVIAVDPMSPEAAQAKTVLEQLKP